MQNNMPTSTVAKGRRVENLARDILKSEGYLVDKKVRTLFASPDFFGKFDLLAIKEDECRFIQVKSNISNFYSARKDITNWLKMYNLQITAEIWLYLGRGKWRKEGLCM